MKNGVSMTEVIPDFRRAASADTADLAASVTCASKTMTLSSSSAKRGSRRSVAIRSATEPTVPTELFVCNADGSGERQLTHLNREWSAQVEVSAPERFSFHRAGFDIDVWVMKPVPFDGAKRYPALLRIDPS